MSAIQQPSIEVPCGLDPDRWIEADDAARILKVHRNALARICRQKLAPRNMAKLARPANGGNARWYLIRTYDAALAPGVMGRINQVPAEFDALPDAKKSAAWAKVNCVEQLREARVSWQGLQKQWLPRLLERLAVQYPDLKLSRTSLLRWDAEFATLSQIMSLVDGRVGKIDRSGPAYLMFRDLWLTDRQRDIIDCWREVDEAAQAKGWEWLTYERLCANLDSWIPPEEQTLHRRPRVYRREFRPFIEKEVDAWQAGICWEGDHRQFNLICRWGKQGKLLRPWLTAWMDRRSRRITGWTLSPAPNSSGILAALRHGLMDPINCGGPDVVWIDNGRDYKCRMFNGATQTERMRTIKIKLDETMAGGLFRQCGIEPHYAIPKNPNGKSFIEGWFDTLEDFDKSFPTYLARTPGDRPESLKGALKALAIPTFEHVLARLTDRIAGYDAMTGAERKSRRIEEVLDGLSPDQYLAQRCPRVKVLPEPRVMDLLMMHWHKPARVHRNGVTIAIAGMRRTYGQFDPALTALKPGKGHKGVQVRVAHDPRDASRAIAFRLDGGLIGELKLNGITGAIDAPHADEQVRELMHDKADYLRAKKIVRKHRHIEYMTAAELHAHKHREEAKPLPGADRPMKLIQTGLEDAAEKLDRRRLRKAAGAEHDVMPDLGSWRIAPAPDGFGTDVINTGTGEVLEGLAALSRASRGDGFDDQPLDLTARNVRDEAEDTDALLDLTTNRLAGEEARDGHLLDEL